VSAWKRAAFALGAAGAVAGAGLAAQRAAARRLRGYHDPDADTEIVAEYDRSYRLPSHDGGELFVVDRGTGPVILLSHGVTLSLRTWAKQLSSLSGAGFRVVAFDHRGHGESTVGGSGHTVENLGADVRTVIEGLDLHDVVLVGHSMGGVAAQSYCINSPDSAHERLAGLVLLSSLTRSVLAGSPRLAAASTWVADRLPDGAELLRARDFGLLVSRLGFGRKPVPSQVEATRQMIVDTHSATRRDAVAALAGLDLSGQIGAIDIPTLIICGTADLLTPVAESRRIAERILGSRLEIVEGGGHMLMFERAELVDGLITRFAREVQQPSSAGDPAVGVSR
jgi:Predicted hydrolases or acyltransferases (alpha/beta hydrolase superfamily)